MNVEHDETIYDYDSITNSLFNTKNALIAYLDTEFKFVRVNNKYAQAGGHPPEFYVGKNHFHLYPNTENEQIFQQVIENDEHVTYHSKPFFYKEYPERGITYWDWDLIPTKDVYGNVSGIILITVDATKRKLAEEELRRTNELLERRVHERTAELEQQITERIKTENQLKQSKQRYRQIFENTSDGIILLDITEENRFVLAAINPSMGKILSLKNVELTGEYLENALPREFACICSQHCINCLNADIQEKYEATIQFQTGKMFMDITLIPIHDDCGRVYRILVICTDITHHKVAAENLIIARVAAERRNKEITEYIANMSHELRTPLNVIMSGLQLFEVYTGSDENTLPGKYRNHLASMKQNSLRLLRLVNNLIDSAKIDSDFFDVGLRNYDIIDIIKTITSSITCYVMNRNLQLCFSSNVEKKIIACDLDVIERIMLNLLSNAIKFTEDNGIIDVSVIDEGSSLTISVKDNGIGISEDQQIIIFERYKQVNQLFTRKHEGSGIGLALTKSLVEALDGSISVSSQPGHGSEFIVKLPCRLAPQDGVLIPEKSMKEQSIIQKISVELSDLYHILQ